MNHTLFVVPIAPEEEVTATLTYEGETFEISYTLMHAITAWVTQGSSRDMRVRMRSNAIAAFNHVTNCMAHDASSLPTSEKLPRPVFKLPYPECTEYAAGHTPRKRRQ